MTDDYHRPEANVNGGDPPMFARVRTAASGEPAAPDAPALEQQIAALAAQVRDLGQRLSSARSGAPMAAAPAAAGLATSQPPLQPVANTSATNASILAIAQAAADEIRGHAEREASLIRDSAAKASSERAAALLEIIAQQCRSVTTLAAEVDRVEQSVTVLREQLAALNDDWRRMLVAAGTVSRHPHVL
jgi:hypothetical protein